MREYTYCWAGGPGIQVVSLICGCPLRGATTAEGKAIIHEINYCTLEVQPILNLTNPLQEYNNRVQGEGVRYISVDCIMPAVEQPDS